MMLVTVPLEALPPEVLGELEIHAEVQPEGYALELAGLTIKTHDEFSDTRLQELQQAVTTARQGAFDALYGNREQEGEYK